MVKSTRMNWDDNNEQTVHDDSSIKGFSGDNRWLSNFYSCDVMYEGMLYPSSEAAYQAAKTTDVAIRATFQGFTASESKKAGKRLAIRDDWDAIKLKVMFDVCWDKFTRNPELQKKLLATGDRYLEETNWWGDTFWGVCKGKGCNKLGDTLMTIRERLSNKH